MLRIVTALVATVILGCSPGPASILDIEGEWRFVGGSRLGEPLDPPEDLSPAVSFGSDGRLGVKPGCNDGGGEYDLVGQQIVVSLFEFTAMACDGPVMEFEADYLEALRSVRLAALDGSSLALTGDRAFLTFERVTPDG